eukprot:3419766-Amphidinium_carterae.1
MERLLNAPLFILFRSARWWTCASACVPTVEKEFYSSVILVLFSTMVDRAQHIGSFQTCDQLSNENRWNITVYSGNKHLSKNASREAAMGGQATGWWT